MSISSKTLSKKYKICIGTVDIAYQFKDLKRGFEKLGHQAETIVLQSSTSYPYDREIIPKIKLPFQKIENISNELIKKVHHRRTSYFKKIVNDFDVFVFIWHSFNSNYEDLAYIKAQGKKIVFIFVGDDARWHHGMRQDFKKHDLTPVEYISETINIFGKEYCINGVNLSIQGLKTRLKRIRQAERHADLIFSKREQSQLQLRPFFHFPMMVFPEDIENNPIQRKINPVVVHAPTNTSVKGTKYVLAAFEQLKKDNIPFQPKLITGMTHQKALECYKNSDIIIDQLLLPGGGKLSTEGLAFGKVVLAKMAYETYHQGFPIENCPIIDVNPENIYEVLKNTILDYPKRVALAKKGRDYVETYLDINKFCKKIIANLEERVDTFDYFPTFFRQEFQPESIEATQLYNKWNEKIKSCEWYQDQVSTGERDGLVF